MFPFKKILCPTDFSEPSLCGLRLASQIVTETGGDLLILNVHRPIPHLPMARDEAAEVTFDVSAYEERVRQDTAVQLEQLTASTFDDDVEPRLIVRMGRPAKEILACAEEEEVDVIVISTHGRTGLAHMVFGSTAERVVRYAKCPVLTIRSCD